MAQFFKISCQKMWDNFANWTTYLLNTLDKLNLQNLHGFSFYFKDINMSKRHLAEWNKWNLIFFEIFYIRNRKFIWWCSSDNQKINKNELLATARSFFPFIVYYMMNAFFTYNIFYNSIYATYYYCYILYKTMIIIFF